MFRHLIKIYTHRDYYSCIKEFSLARVYGKIFRISRTIAAARIIEICNGTCERGSVNYAMR